MEHTTEYQEYPKDNREHKSTLFCKVFEDKKYLLELYNGVNQTNYQNIDDLEVNTLENVVYIKMKNDLSFLIDCNVNVFSSSPQMIPFPQYIVFYNGTQEQPDEQILLLSDLFQKKQGESAKSGCLECKARMLNINYGRNKELLQKCRRLEEYAIFVAKVRQYVAEDIEKREAAITRAIDESVAEGVLVDILKEQKAEVLELVLTTFNKELYEQGLKEDATKEANEKIAALKKQLQDSEKENKEKDEQLQEKDKYIAELEAKLAKGN